MSGMFFLKAKWEKVTCLVHLKILAVGRHWRDRVSVPTTPKCHLNLAVPAVPGVPLRPRRTNAKIVVNSVSGVPAYLLRWTNRVGLSNLIACIMLMHARPPTLTVDFHPATQRMYTT